MTEEHKKGTRYIAWLFIVATVIAGVLAYGHYDRQRKIDAFITAVAGNDIQSAKTLLQKESWLINVCPGKSNKTPLFWARSKEMAELLIGAGADLEKKDRYGRTPLLHSIIIPPQGHHAGGAATETLITAGADVNARDNDGITPLLMATYYGNIEAIEALLAHHADVNAGDNHGYTPLRYAQDIGNSAMSGLLRAHGARE